MVSAFLGGANVGSALRPLLHWIHEARDQLGQRHILPCDSSDVARQWKLPMMEFGYEVFLEVPRVYEACTRGEVGSLTICRGRYPLYFFVPRRLVKERSCVCKFTMCEATEKNLSDFHKQKVVLSLAQQMPPYARAFRAPRAAPMVFMWNKFNTEWEGGPVNYWPEHSVTAVLRAAKCVGPAVFWRWPNKAELGTGGVLNASLADMAAARASGRAQMLADLVDIEDVELLNVAQLVLLTTAEVAIGVQGGIATLGSAVGARMLLLCKRGRECAGHRVSHDFSWHPSIAGGSLATIFDPNNAVQYLNWLCRKPAYFHVGAVGRSSSTRV